jgi:hypothetical protein
MASTLKDDYEVCANAKSISLTRLREKSPIVIGSGARACPRATPVPPKTIIHQRPSELTQHGDRELARSAHEMLRKNNFPSRARAKMGHLGAKTMDFELENVLTQPWLASCADQKAKRVGASNTRTSQEVTHPSTTLAQASLSAEF